jgi:hypothetical protein
VTHAKNLQTEFSSLGKNNNFGKRRNENIVQLIKISIYWKCRKCRFVSTRNNNESVVRMAGAATAA